MGSEDVSAKVAVAIHGFCKLHKYVINLLQEGVGSYKLMNQGSSFILFMLITDLLNIGNPAPQGKTIQH